ncbi:MAG: DUF4139 domain-containing protein, partial [Myxococcota bacterium]|nr:DUF4139 domain-containing protein [Myxococcota bacterium]
SYRSPCALWRPEHWAQLRVDEGDAGQGTIELVTYATAWQATGERWEDVSVSFSTARPSRASSPPLLADDVLRSRKKAPEERRRIVVESRDETLSTTGAAGVRSVDEMPGVDDGGEPLQYRGAAPLSLPSNGEPFRVEIGRRQLDAKVVRLLRGEASELAHLLAKTQLEGSAPLLAGPVRILRGDSLLGRAKLDFVAPGEAFEMGFGPDDAIRLRRRVQTKRHESLTGQQRIEFEVLLYLSNLSNEERALQLVERIPVSELDGLHVELKESEGFGALDEDGLIIAECKLAGNGQQKLKLSFNVEAPAKMVLPF